VYKHSAENIKHGERLDPTNPGDDVSSSFFDKVMVIKETWRVVSRLSKRQDIIASEHNVNPNLKEVLSLTKHQVHTC
jgi:hypothetical protein